MKLLTVLFVFMFSFSITVSKADDKIGVLLMHGKRGTALPKSPIGGLVDFLESNNILVVAPDMPWSREREYDKTFAESLSEIDEHVAALREKGATKIVIGGHSLGANVALGYGARREGITGILAIAPGHVPEIEYFQDKIDHDWRRAKKMVDQGKADQIESFNDVNQGRRRKQEMRAEVYLSWFDPQGPAVMPINIAKLKSGTSLLWLVGEDDRMYDRGKRYAFNNAPKNKKNMYIVVEGGHKMTPRNGSVEILRWLGEL